MSDCLFVRLSKGKFLLKRFMRTKTFMHFMISIVAPHHFLVIPKKHISTLNDVDDPTLVGKLSLAASKIAKDMGFAENGYRVTMNCNDDGAQTVYHIHLHCLGGRQMTWPPG